MMLAHLSGAVAARIENTVIKALGSRKIRSLNAGADEDGHVGGRGSGGGASVRGRHVPWRIMDCEDRR